MTIVRAFAGLLLCLCFAAPAYCGDGFYVSLEGGGGAVNDWQHTRTWWTPCGPEVKQARASFDTNLAGFGAAGYRLGDLRFELEGGYRRNPISSYLKDGWKKTWEHEGEAGPSGALTEGSLMANLIYDIQLFERFSLALGVGAGGDNSRFKLDTHWAPIDKGDYHFAYQGIAGLNYALSEEAVVFVNYRFTDVRNISFDATPRLHLAGDDFEKQAATAGLRFALFVPAAVVPPAPPPTPPAPKPLEREFMVFFGFNQSNLSDEELATIKQVVGAVRESGSAAVHVIGHADRAGSIAYNKALSLRRARSVRAALVSEGVAAAAISIAGRGESEPMVPTADGVREAQNRRVHISF